MTTDNTLSQCKSVLMIDKYKAKHRNVQGVESLEEIRKRNINRIVMFHLNINSSRNMFDSLIEQITGNVEIFMMSETTIVFRGLVLNNGYSHPFRVDQNCQYGEIMLYIRKDIHQNF